MMIVLVAVRVWFADLNGQVYEEIGRALRAVARSYRQAYEAAKGKAAGGKASKAKSPRPGPAPGSNRDTKESGPSLAGRPRAQRPT